MEMQGNLVQQGVELMLYGMGTVFTFLVLLIIATSLMSFLLQRFVKPGPTAVAPAQANNNKTSGDDEQLIAVISAAIHKYRSRRK